MSINRSKVWLAFGLPLLFASMALAQETPDNEWVPGVRDFQPFAPASDMTSHYGSGPRRRRGWFFTIEDLAWSTSSPERAPIGNPDFLPLVTSDGTNYFQQTNSMDTGFIQPSLRQGERLQLGYTGEDGAGWLVGTFVVHSSVSGGATSNAGVSFASPFINGANETEGFVEQIAQLTNGTGGSGSTGGLAVFDKDINQNGIFGASGRDIGSPNANPPPTFVPPPDGIPDVPAPTDFGDLVQLPMVFSHVRTQYSSRVWGIEVMRTWWLSKSRRPDHGYWDFMAGVRYVRFRDNFYFSGTGYQNSVVLQPIGGGTGGTTGSSIGKTVSGLLSDTYFTQTADNNLVGPQIGLRWFKERGRLSWSVEGRGGAMANFQNNRQVGSVASHSEAGRMLPTFTVFPQANNPLAGQVVPQVTTPFLQSAGVNHTQHTTQFSPLGELRFNLNYQIFRNLQATVGWTGLVMGGIARSPDIVSYTLPDLGIQTAHNRQVLFIQGINFGLNLNR